MAQGGAASSKPVMPFYTLNLKTQEKVSALEEKWQVHFDWLTDVVAEAKVKYAKPGEERELSLLTQTPGPKRTRTARKNKASDSQTAQDQVEMDAKSTKSRTTTATTSRSSRTTKAAQKSSLSALEENQNEDNSELSTTPDDRNEKSNSNVRETAAELDHPIEFRVEDTNKSSSDNGKQNEASKVEDALLKTAILETTEENEEIAAKNQEISICPREDDTLELVLENTNELSETITKQQEHGQHGILENETMDERSIEIEEPVLDLDETDEAFKSKTVTINGSLVKTSEECKDKPESGNNETEHVEIVKKSFQSEDTNEDFVDDVFETTNEIETNKNNMDVQTGNLLHANKKHANRLTNSVVSESTSVEKSMASISADNNSQLVSPLPATIANATFTVDDEIEFRREEASNIVNSTFVVESRQSVTSQVDDTVSEVNETVDDSLNKRENSFSQSMKQIPRNNSGNIQSGESGLSRNLVESNEVASPSEKIQSPLSVTGTSIDSDEQDSIVDNATPTETSIVIQKQSTYVPSQEDDNSTPSPAAGFASPNVVSQDVEISSFKLVGKASKKASITSDGQDRSPTRSGKEKVHPSVRVSQQETSEVRETRSSRSSRNRSTKESLSSDQQDKPPTRTRNTVSQDGEDKSLKSNTDRKDNVRSTRSKQKQDKLEESSPAKTKENLSQPFEVSKKSDTTSRSRQPEDGQRSQSGSDNDEASSTRNDCSGSILQHKSASRRSRRSSIASSLFKVSAARKHSVVELLQTMEGSLVTLVSAESPANASAVASKSNGTSQSRAKAGKVSRPKKAATRGVAPASRGVTPGSTYRGMTPGTMGGRTTPGVVGGSRTTPGVVGGSRTTPGVVGGSRTTPGSVGSHNGGRVRSRLGIMEKANRGTPGKGGATSSQPNRSRHPSASEQMEEEKKMQEKAAEALKKKEELMKQKTDEQRNKREARIKRVQEARQAKEKEIRKKNEVKEAEEKLAAQAKRDKKLKEDAERRRINEERQKMAEEKEEQAIITLAAELKNKEEALEAELRNREAAEQAKKMRDEEERRREREKKEEERRLLAEAKQREAETIAREKEKLRKAQAEELKENANLNSTYTKPSSALDQSKSAGPSSYNMTPSRHAGNLPPEPLENENDYGLDDLDSEGSTDDEDQPRKEVPKWAEGGLLRTALLKQSYMGPDLDAIFASIEMPELADMFHHQRKRFFKRTSSAVWDTAPTSFKHGQR